MREHPFHWPPRDDLGYVAGMELADGGGMICAKYRVQGLPLWEQGMKFWDYMEKLNRAFPNHWRVGMEAIGCMGRSRNVSRQHPLNQGETGA